jgi:hypothetical protein
MEVFRELWIRGEPSLITHSMDEIERCLPEGWSRDRRLEAQLKSRSILDINPYCFSVIGIDHLPEADFFLVETDDHDLKVSNIVPRDQSQLSFGQYNALLEEFYEQIAIPCSNKTGLGVELTPNHVELSQWLSKTANRKLLAFSAKARERTAALQRDDRRRWLDFVFTAHREESQLPSGLLGRWLREVEGWEPEIADRLVTEYAFGGDILSFSESQPA